jgi:BirA family biotin operon repressor/biotin-[acetyl-CoA-carboxylase] ligase
VTSTNDEAKRLIASADTPGSIPFGTVVIADEQTAGRGRRGRVFASPAADSVYVSFVLAPAAEVSATLLVTITAAVAVCEAIEAVTAGGPAEAAAPGGPFIKWVNDIFIDGKKVCGILTEAVSAADGGGIDGLALGVGVNINVPPEGFPEELREIAGSVNIAPRDRALFAAELITRVFSRYEDLMKGRSPVRAYRERSFIIGRDITVIGFDGSEVPAVAEDIADDGSLLVRYADGGRASLTSGEINTVTASARR